MPLTMTDAKNVVSKQAADIIKKNLVSEDMAAKIEWDFFENSYNECLLNLEREKQGISLEPIVNKDIIYSKGSFMIQAVSKFKATIEGWIKDDTENLEWYSDEKGNLHISLNKKVGEIKK